MHLKGHGRCTQRFNLKSMRKYTTWTDCVVRKYDLCKKAPSWNIFIMWKQTGGEDVVRNMEQTNASSVNTRGLSSGKFTIDLHGKEMGWVMGPQSWPLQWRKRAQPLDYFQTDRSEHRGKVYSWKEKTLIKNRLEALGNRIPFSGKNIEALLVPDPGHPPGWRRRQHHFGLGAVFLVGCSGLCARQAPVWSTPSGCLCVWGPPLTCLQRGT